MKTYFGAFVGALFLMLLVSVFAEGIVWITLTAFHASKTVLMAGEIIMLPPLFIAFIFVFRSTLETERELSEQGY